jgi:Tol biopolymer transport system component/DNA-binding winged helix-turn-helix (wHTH) protein
MQPSAGEGNPRPKSRFGVFEFDPQARELTKHGVRLKLQEQPIQILAALLEQAGRIVPREELQRRLWPDGTFVDYEQSLNKAVNKLREALGDSAAKPVYIETLARRGYRFVAPVEVDWPTEPERPKETTQGSKTARSHARRWWGAGALGLVTVGLLVTGLWPVPALRVRVTQLTRRSWTDFSLVWSWVPSVHGARILYPWTYATPDHRLETQFWSISTEGGEPRRERMPFLNPEYDAWLCLVDSRLGVILIRSQVPSSSVTRGELWLAGFDGSKPRRIAEAVADSSYSISPDLKTLLRSSKEGLFARPVDGWPERLVARIDWKTPSDTFWHPSGERIGFVVARDGPAKLWEVKIDGTGMRPLLPQFQAEQVAGNWSPDGKKLYFVSDGEIYVRGSRRWLGWMRRPQPQRLTAGSVRYISPVVEDPTDPSAIYTVGSVGHGESMKLDKQTGLFEPYLGGLSAECLDYSPDGRWIAYVSYPDRNLWKCRRDGSDKVLLEDRMDYYMPRWSPDGKRLAVAALRKWGDPYRIYTIPAAGGRAEPVNGVNGPGFDPNWSPDGKKLVFAPLNWGDPVPEQDRHVSIVDLETGQVQMVPGSEEMFSPRWSPDGKHLVAIRLPQFQPAIYDFETRRWADVDAKFFGFPTWSKDSKYVHGMWNNPFTLVRIEVATRKLEEIRSIKEFSLAGNLSPGVSWTPDGEPVVLASQSTVEIYRLDVQW